MKAALASVQELFDFRTLPRTMIYLVMFVMVTTSSYHLYRTRSPVRYDRAAKFREGHNIYCADRAGIDFRCVHMWGRALSQSMDEFLKLGNTYPPLMILLYWPLSLVSENMAYFLFVWILEGFMFYSIYSILKQCLDSRNIASGWVWVGAGAFWAFFNHTYPVVFSLERGNSDLVALGFACAFLAALQRGCFYWATAALFMATQIKIYPALLVFLLLKRAGWKFVFIFTILNVAALFALGWVGLVNFLEGLDRLMHPDVSWAGNHSFQGYFIYAFPSWDVVNRELTTSILKYGFLGSFAAILSFDAIRRGYLWTFSKPRTEQVTHLSLGDVGLIGMACQIMCLLPATSHDYKLVIQILPALLLLSRSVETISRHERFANLILVLLGILNALIFSPYHFKMPLLVITFFGYLTLWIVSTRGGSAEEPRAAVA